MGQVPLKGDVRSEGSEMIKDKQHLVFMRGHKSKRLANTSFILIMCFFFYNSPNMDLKTDLNKCNPVKSTWFCFGM